MSVDYGEPLEVSELAVSQSKSLVDQDNLQVNNVGSLPLTASKPPAEDEPVVEVAAIAVDSPPVATSELLVDEPAVMEVRANTIKSSIAAIPKSVTGKELGDRLIGASQSDVSKNKDKINFSEWIKGKDPDNIGWRYDPTIKGYHRFFPVLDAPSV